MTDSNVFTFKPRKYYDSKKCQHKRFTLDSDLQTVECSDCNISLSPFWVLNQIAENEARNNSVIEYKKQQLEKALNEAEAPKLHLKAAKHLENIWRSRSMLPICHYCGNGLEALKMSYCGSISKEYQEQRNRFKNKE